MNLKKLERYLRVNMLRPGPRLTKKRIYRAAVSQSLRNTALDDFSACLVCHLIRSCLNAHSRAYVEHNRNNHMTQI